MKINSRNLFVLVPLLVCFLGTSRLVAQQSGQLTLSGPTTAYIGENATYTLQDLFYGDGSVGYDYWDMEWFVNKGYFITPNTYEQTSVEVHWDTGGYDSVYVLYDNRNDWNQYYAELAVTITPEPSIPEIPIIESISCNEVVLHRGTPPDGITWYWQSSSAGTSTANSNESITLTSGSQYFLRALSSFTGYWSTSREISYGSYFSNPTTWYLDADGDGFGDPASPLVACTHPNQYVTNNSDQCPNQYGTTNGCPTTGTGGTGTGGTVVDTSGVVSGLNDASYIYTLQPKVAVAAVSQLTDPSQKIHSITYYDGLGRPMQQHAIGFGGNGEDIITPIVYDAFGRPTKDYLPYATASNGGQLRTGDITGTVQSFYNVAKYANTQNPFSEKVLENSPLNRVLEQAAPGDDWSLSAPQKHTIQLGYQTNTADEVQRFDVSLTADYVPSITANGSYAVGELYKTVTTDENNHSTEEFKDKEGHVVLKRNYDSGVAHDTYYVYDVYGNLTYVLPPKAEGATSATVLDDLCYQYQYDYRNRLVAKKLPGKQWEYMVYDKLDRVVATGPAFSPFSDVTGAGWLITKYDVFNRVVYTGWLNSPANNSTRGTMQQAQTNATTINESKQNGTTIDGIAVNYSNNVLPNTFKLLTVNYYDNYTIPTVSVSTSVEGQTVATMVKGMSTGSWTRVATTTAETKGETSYILYDTKYRPIRNYTTNYLGGYTSTDSKLDVFSGQLQYTIQKHKRTTGDSELVVKEAFTYSPQDRLIQHTHQINGGAVQLLAENTYDELGKLISKKVGNTSATPLQKVDYSYNIRGWLTAINSIANLNVGTDPADLFSFKLNYNMIDGSTGAADKLYNGNIAETFWSTATDGGFVRNYGYKYDNLNRLKDATYQKSNVVTNMYNENLSYDKNGNIMNLSRYGDRDEQYLPIQIDNLGYNYGTNSNQLKSVTDATNNTSGFKDGNTTGDDYVYDGNGNMIVDKNKHITSITYNHLNLPTQITFGTTGNIVYFYTASGQKVKKVVTSTTPASVVTTDYLGGYQYSNSSLQFFPTAEGYVKNTPVSGTNTYSYVFNYTDHLGNVRLSYTKNPSTNALDIIEENNYYPFGLKHNGYNPITPTPDYKYKFQGQERQDELGLNWDSFKWRNYDMAIGRFMSIDPLAEEYAYNSTYAFAENKLGMGRELEGCELGPLFGVAEIVKVGVEVTGKTSEVVGKTSEVAGKATEGAGKFSETQLKDFARGNAAEAEQLAKNGLEKNTKPYEATDPKTGQSGKTIPDSFDKSGGTVEVKNVKYQPETSQLRLQRVISNLKGAVPRLIINEGAKLSKNLTNGNYKIDTYGITPNTTVKDNTAVKMPELPKPAPKPKPDPNAISI